MDADRALKKLFKLRATELLPVIGDGRAQVLSRLVPEGLAPSSLAHEERIAGRVMCRRRISVVGTLHCP